MSTQRKSYSAEFKSKVAVEAIRGFKTINELAAEYGIHPHQISMWKAQLLQAAPGVFSGGADHREKEAEALRDKLYQQIGKLQTELDWLKKKLDPSVSSVEHKRALIDRVEAGHHCISIRRQFQLLGLHRSNLYYEPALEEGQETEENEALMRLLDEQYTQTPFYGVRRMTEWLRIEGQVVNPKRVRRLLREMGLWAIYPGPSTSKAAPGHRIYPYLLRGVPIKECNQVWSTDITYVRLRRGFCYSAIWWR